MRFENSITIGRPPAEVFAYLADFEKLPSWNYAIVETRKLSEGPVGMGTTYRQVRKLPRPTEESFEVTELPDEHSARLSPTPRAGRSSVSFGPPLVAITASAHTIEAVFGDVKYLNS